LRAAAMMLLAAALIAVTTLLAKALGRGLPAGVLAGGEADALSPFQVSAGRFAFAFLALGLVALWRRPGFAGTAWRLHAGRSLSGWLGVTCLFAAAASLPLAEATAIGFLSPVATMLLAIPLLGERVGRVRWLAAGVALSGALVLLRPGMEAVQPAALLALAAAGLLGLEAVLIKRLTGREPALRILLVNNAIGAGLSGAAAVLVWVAPSPGQWAMLAALGLSMVLAQACFLQAMKAADASYAIPFFYATLVFAALYDLAVFGDHPDALGILGAAIVVAGAILLAGAERRRRPSPGRPGPPGRGIGRAPPGGGRARPLKARR
jgi:drug/metabolite transporter (DMT)-like permease